MSETSDDFDRLLGRLREGDEAALAALVERYAGVIRRTARGLLGPALRPHLDSVDIVQSVHRTLLIGLRRQQFEVSTPQQLVALATTLVRRKVARQWRRMRRRPTAHLGDSALADVLAEARGPQDDPARDAQVNDTVRELLAALDDTDRRLLELRLDGHSTAGAARELGLAPAFLRLRLSRLRKRLRERGLLDEWL